MRIFSQSVLFFLSLVIFIGCAKDDEYYDRPATLADPIYMQLETRGNFKHYLSVVAKANYKKTLEGAGYFTVFAPNDAAFEAFFEAQGLAGVDAIDAEMARKIVGYSLVYNSFEKARLSDYQSNIGWVPLNAYKRRTAYYTGVYDYTRLDGSTIKVTASNRNGAYLFADNNNKYIPYFITDYMEKVKITAADYNYFFPTIPFTGFNVVDASVVTQDIIAENGVIHEIDKVILPLPSIDEYLDQKSQYKAFKDIMEKYVVGFDTHPEVTNRYKVLTGSSDPVYVKFYSSLLGFSPNNENFLKSTDNDGQSNGWTMFAPNNDAVNKYVNEVLLAYGYTSVDLLPTNVITDFINAHFWPTTVWPSKFSSTANALGEEARFNQGTDISEAKVLSNGFLYGTTKAQDADVFRSVFGKAYLNPQYSLMTRFLERELKSTLVSPFAKFTLLLVSDAELKLRGHDLDPVTGQWLYNSTRDLAIENWTRMIYQHAIIGQYDDFSGEGIVETMGGEYIRYSNNTLFAGGNQEAGTLTIPFLNRSAVVTVQTVPALKKDAFNGKVHYLNGPLNFPTKGPGWYIRTLGDVALVDGNPKPYKRFYELLKNSTLPSIYLSNLNLTENILGMSAGLPHTIFIPTDAAIQQAITDGVLVTTDQDKVANFLFYHIIPKFSIVNNGKESGTFETLYKTETPQKVTVNNSTGVFTVVDKKGRTANVVPGYINSNVLGNRIVIHQIDNYLDNR